MKSDNQEAITRYTETLSTNHAAICRVLRKEIDAALPKAASKIWHGSPVWFIGENPVVGYNATPKHVNLLFWSGQLFGDSALKPVGKFKAAQIQFTEEAHIEPKTLRRWLKKAGLEIWDYQSHFKTQIASRRKGKTKIRPPNGVGPGLAAIVAMLIGTSAIQATGQPVKPKPQTELVAQKSPSGADIVLAGLGIGESPRWHDGRLWLCNWGRQEIVAVDDKGKSEVMVRVSTSLPFCIDWLSDGRLLVVSGRERLLLRREPDGSLTTHADLRRVAEQNCNEIVVDGRGSVYVNGGGVDRPGQKPSGMIALVAPDGSVRKVADGLVFPNGMAVTPDNSTLIIAESQANRLTAFAIAADGSLSNRRVWAYVGDGVPDGICLDADKAVWYADVPNKRCVRVREGGQVLQTITVDRGCFACTFGGADKSTRFIVAAEWHGFEKMMDGLGTGRVLAIKAPAPGVGWP